MINEEGPILENVESISKEILHFFEKSYSRPSGDSWRLKGLD